MVMTFTTMLVSIAEFSNIFSVLAVLLCFCAMILFITRNMMVLRVHGEDIVFQNPLHQVSPRIPQMNMMKVHIPYTFKLIETSKSSYSDGVLCLISSQVRYKMLVYWGVNIRELHINLWRPWTILKDELSQNIFLKGNYQQLGYFSIRDPHGDEVITLSLPDSHLDLGTPPRLCYPLVIFLIRLEDSGVVHPDETVSLINVVHIKDSVCTLPTSILAQYLKQANGQLSCLKQLYLATGNPGSYEDGQIPLAVAEPVGGGNPEAIGRTLLCPTRDDSTIWNTSGEQLCVVCQYFPLSRALLPCRHTCICASCFDRLDRCPLCRGPIKSYFCIRGEDYIPIETETKNGTQNPAHGPFYTWLDSWNDRLIDFLGFQR